MRWLLLVVISLLGLFQYQLWFGDGGLREQTALQQRIEKQTQENNKLEVRNQKLVAAVAGLKDGTESIEERARNDLGMTREDETFYMVIEQENQD